MKKFIFILLFSIGLVFNLSAKQICSYWKAETEEDKAKIIEHCSVEIKVMVSLGLKVVSVALNDDGYLIVYEDFE